MSNRPKTKILAQLTPSLAVALVIVMVTGCASAGYHKGDAAAVSLQTAADDVRAESRAVELTLGLLKDMVSDPSGDLQRPYRNFSRSLNQLIACAQRTENTGKRMEQRQAEYLRAWDKQLGTIEFEQIRRLSENRKAQVSSQFESINHRYHENAEVVQPLIAYFQDIRRAVDIDLTPGGLEAMKEVVHNAETNADKVQTALGALVSELTNSSTKMSSIALRNTGGSEE